MRTPPSIRNGDLHRIAPHHQFISTVTLQKLRRFNILILIFRLAAFSFSFSASVFMVTNSKGSGSPAWHDYDAFRFVFVANAIVALYSLYEMAASVWEISRGITLLPEGLQVWIDFGHDQVRSVRVYSRFDMIEVETMLQVLAYLLISAEAAGTEVARRLKVTEVCGEESAGFFCVQSDIAIALGFAGFLFLGFSSLLSGFRVVSFLVNGTRFNL